MNKYQAYSEALFASSQDFKNGNKLRAIGFWLWYILTPISIIVLIIGGFINFWPHSTTPTISPSPIISTSALRVVNTPYGYNSITEQSTLASSTPCTNYMAGDSINNNSGWAFQAKGPCSNFIIGNQIKSGGGGINLDQSKQ